MIKKTLFLLVSTWLCLGFTTTNKSVIFKCTNGTISFQSDAPLELIEAKSTKLQGVIDPDNRTFAWSIDVKSFRGFNSPMQAEHFNENYLDSRKYPTALFSGRIIEEIDLTKEGTFDIRAKGKLMVHGIEKERIIKVTATVKNNQIRVESKFSVELEDHGIRIPKIVNQKISEEIFITVNALLTAV